ncbi:hypothetical protein VH567_02810 [Sphingomonas sp. 4RDLI-65]|uniref:hypothetical protein n=1 Tax=Sphingomonas sp. 4RDLI-65 TaxID=3111641 RepID=UPI003C1A0593
MAVDRRHLEVLGERMVNPSAPLPERGGVFGIVDRRAHIDVAKLQIVGLTIGDVRVEHVDTRATDQLAAVCEIVGAGDVSD